LSAENTAKAYQLRDRTSDRERFFISVTYDRQVTGNLERAVQTLESWTQAYPRDPNAHSYYSGYSSKGLGKYLKSVEEARKAIVLDPEFSPGYANLADSLVYLDRFKEAEEALHAAAARNIEVPDLLMLRYRIGFLRDDEAAMEREIARAVNEQGAESWVTYAKALVLARLG